LANPAITELPIMQEQLADALGLTAVHTNRTLMTRGDEGFITGTQRAVQINMPGPGSAPTGIGINRWAASGRCRFARSHPVRD
jgi:hypothetical protein